MLEEYGTIIKYIKGTDNEAEETLIRIPLINSDVTESDIIKGYLSEIYCANKQDGDTFL